MKTSRYQPVEKTGNKFLNKICFGNIQQTIFRLYPMHVINLHIFLHFTDKYNPSLPKSAIDAVNASDRRHDSDR